MAQIYDDPKGSSTAEAVIRSLQQGKRSVEEYGCFVDAKFHDIPKKKSFF